MYIEFWIRNKYTQRRVDEFYDTNETTQKDPNVRYIRDFSEFKFVSVGRKYYLTFSENVHKNLLSSTNMSAEDSQIASARGSWACGSTARYQASASGVYSGAADDRWELNAGALLFLF